MSDKKPKRREFLFTVSYAVGAVGVGAVVLGAIIGFVMWARRTTEGSWNETELWE